MTIQQDSASSMESGDVYFDSGETTPLLSTSPSETSLEIRKHDTTEPYVLAAKNEARWILSSSSLVILTFMLQSSFFFVNVMAVSHIGAKELAAMSLSVTCMGIVAFAPAVGLLSAMDTFCSTAFTASKDKTLVGFHFQRGLISAFSHLIVVAPILWNAESILLALKQDPEIAHLSGTYMKINILGILPWSMFEASKRYLQAQGIMRAGITIVAIIAPIHWFNNFFFVRSPTYGIGFIGAPVVNVISNWLMFFGILIYIRLSRATETWGGWTISAFHNMSAYYKLAFPAIITVCSEWVAFELLTIAISYFGANQLAANAIMLNSVGLIFQISNGLGFGTSPRIGNLIGAAKPRQARIAAEMALLTSGFIGLMGTLFLVFCGDWWTLVYTSDPEVVQATAKLLPVACIFIASDGLNAVLSAILRGLGRQNASANIFLIGFYLCAVPFGLYLGYVLDMQSVGLWWGLCTGVVVSCILQIYYIFKKVDWDNEVRQCLLRLKNSRDTTSKDIDTNSSEESNIIYN